MEVLAAERDQASGLRRRRADHGSADLEAVDDVAIECDEGIAVLEHGHANRVVGRQHEAAVEQLMGRHGRQQECSVHGIDDRTPR